MGFSLQYLFTVYNLMVITITTSVTFTIDTTNTSGPNLVDEYLSVAIDTYFLSRADANPNDWSMLDDEKVNTLAKGLSPTYFRFGGTYGDTTIYDTDGSITNSKSWPKETLNMTELSNLIDFSSRNGWQMVFGLDAQERFPSNNTWNPTNSIELMKKVIHSNKYSTNNPLIYGYELSNEPNAYPHNGEGFPYNVTAKQLANDFKTLYNVINENVYSSSNYKPFIWGCDTSNGDGPHFPYLGTFGNHSNHKMINGLSWHFYYGSSSSMNISTFISPMELDILIKYLQGIVQIKANNGFTTYILGETGCGWGGGVKNLSDTFIAGFMWLDKLGLNSIYGNSILIYEAFWGDDKGLLGRDDWNPNPLYWVSYIFKHLIGEKVLWVNNQFDLNRYIRIYSFCTNYKNNIYNKGSITVLMINLHNNTIEIDFNLKGVINNNNMYYDEYLLTTTLVNSRSIYLNNILMEMPNNKTLPTLLPNTIKYGSTIKMNALSYGFIVVANANAIACINS
eukprot:355505_1